MQYRNFRLVSVVSLVALVAAGAARAADDDWQFKLGAGAGYAPKYEGSDNYGVIPLPVISADYKDGLFFVSFKDGVGSYPIRGEHFKLGAALGYDRGRDQDDDRDNLNGMGDVDGGAKASLLGEYDFGFARLSGEVATGSGDYGTTADLKLGSRYPLDDRFTLLGSVGATWADGEHMENYFGVSTAQAARTRYSRYDAGAGLKSVGASVGVSYAITPEWSTNLMLAGKQLVGDAADSPIARNDFNPSLFLTTVYTF